ncbi:MAG: hypothetical protein GEU92_20715, partial [Alphaproteobacteria bacterium]|nr:hypothetical protein [Alphaproteobacteria bacterium]
MANPARLNRDVAQAFALTELRTFRLPGGSPYALVSHCPEAGVISDFWLGSFGSQAEFRAVLDFVAGEIEAGRYRLWLADLRYMSTGFGNSNEWLVGDLMPRVLRGGLVREAVVLTEDSGVPEGYDVFGSATGALRR